MGATEAAFAGIRPKAQGVGHIPTAADCVEGAAVMKDQQEPVLPKKLFDEMKTRGSKRDRGADKIRSGATQPSLADEPEHSHLWQSIRQWRAEAARKKNVPPYTLFWDRTIDDLCMKKPRTLEALGTSWASRGSKMRCPPFEWSSGWSVSWYTDRKPVPHVPIELSSSRLLPAAIIQID